MLTAIVVGVATLGLALSVCLRIYRGYGTVEEDELLEKLEREDARNTGRPKRRRPRRKPAARAAVTEKSKSENPRPRRSRTNRKGSKPGSSEGTRNDSNKPVTEKKKTVRKARKKAPPKPKEDNS